NLFALLLGHAPQHAKPLALLVELFVVVEAVKYLLFCLIPDRAGVVKDQVGVFFRFDAGIALVLKRPNDLFRVVGIHLAPERLDKEGLGAALVGNYGRHGGLSSSIDYCPPSRGAGTPWLRGCGPRVWRHRAPHRCA